MVDPRCLPPDTLKALAAERLGQHAPPPHSARSLRESAEAAMAAKPNQAQGLDGLLVALRDLELAEEGHLPGGRGLARGRALAQDLVSVTLEAWDNEGRRGALRLPRPALAADPVTRRRLALRPMGQHDEAILSFETRFDDDGEARPWVALGGPSLAELLPVEDWPEPRLIAACLIAGLRGLAALQQQGLGHGALGPEHLIFTLDGVRLAWLDPVLPTPPRPEDDLAALGRAVGALDPEGHDSLGALAWGFAESPPPNVGLAVDLLRRSMGQSLLERRHELAMHARAQGRRHRHAQALHLSRRLSLALPPPAGVYCLKAERDAVMVLADATAAQLRGRPATAWPTRFLPVLWSPEHGLDASAARSLVRAWTTRARGDEPRRVAQQAELGSTDEGAAGLVRWVQLQLSLRTERMLVARSTP